MSNQKLERKVSELNTAEKKKGLSQLGYANKEAAEGGQTNQ